MHDDETLSLTARALGHPARVRILRLLSRQAQCRGADIFSDIPLAQSTVSEHLRILRDAGLIASHSTGAAAVYCISRGQLEPLREFLDTVINDAPMCAPSEREATCG